MKTGYQANHIMETRYDNHDFELNFSYIYVLLHKRYVIFTIMSMIKSPSSSSLPDYFVNLFYLSQFRLWRDWLIIMD